MSKPVISAPPNFAPITLSRGRTAQSKGKLEKGGETLAQTEDAPESEEEELGAQPTAETSAAARQRFSRDTGARFLQHQLLAKDTGKDISLADAPGEVTINAARVADEPEPDPEKQARETIDEAMKFGVGDWGSDTFVRDKISADILKYAKPEEKSHMLKLSMDGTTGSDDQKAIRRILKSTENSAELKKVVADAGGAERVYSELQSQRVGFISDLKAKGDDGHKGVREFIAAMPVGSANSDEIVRSHVDAEVLKKATPDEKTHMLKLSMEGITGSGDQKAIRRVLGSTANPAELRQVIKDGGGAERVYSELQDQRSGFIADQKAKGEDGYKAIRNLISDMKPGAANSDQLVRDHVDAKVLKNATNTEKGHMIKLVNNGWVSSVDNAAKDKILSTATNTRDLLDIAKKGGGLGVLGMNASHETLVTGALSASAGNRSFDGRVKDLLLTPKFQSLSATDKTAVLSQIKNYPDSRSAANVKRLVEKDWFQNFSTADKQRSLKVVAFLSQHPGDRTVIGNTLNRFLDSTAPYEFDWTKEGRAYGSAGTTKFHFNRKYLAADNNKVNTSDSGTLHMVTHTVAHEVNHLVNKDKVAKSFDYFMGEYRGFYVGFKAQHGRAPTRAEVINRVRHLLTAKTGAYSYIASALKDPVEGPKIATFMQGVLGDPTVTAANAATAAVKNPGNTAPTPTGDLNN